jgi:hypothetical protein
MQKFKIFHILNLQSKTLQVQDIRPLLNLWSLFIHRYAPEHDMIFMVSVFIYV